MNRPFVLVLVVVLVLDPMAWFRGRGRAGGRLGSWSQCTVARPRGLSMNRTPPCPSPQWGYVFNVVGTSRCDVRAAPSRRRSHSAYGRHSLEGLLGGVFSRRSRYGGAGACSGATLSIANVPRPFRSAAATRVGTARRAVPTVAVNGTSGKSPQLYRFKVFKV